jgi:NAD(P)-dependent dehydrogenase (short-subunit alcohol dehydrogenase family)
MIKAGSFNNAIILIFGAQYLMVFLEFANYTGNLCENILANGKFRMKLPEELQFIANSRMEQKTTNAVMDGRVCLITGATSGVGYHAAKQLALGGANLILVCRNKNKASKVQSELEFEYGAKVVTLQADFANLGEVRNVAAAVLDTHPRIDVLINNAGLHMTRRKLTDDHLEIVFCVNHLASFLLTRLLLERLKESSPSRIIQVNSQGHRFGGLDLDDLNWERRRYRGLQGYGASKTAQLLTVWEFADRLNGSGVTINAMHPGAVKTNIGMNNGLIYQWYQRIVIWPLLKEPKISGKAIYYLAAAPEMLKISGNYFNQTINEKPASHALDRTLGKRVWQISEELTNLTKMD